MAAPSSMIDGKSPRKDGSGSGGSVISQTVAAPPARKDPNEEFFMMTFLSYKLNHRQYEKVLAVRIKFMQLDYLDGWKRSLLRSPEQENTIL
jgi:hypothetical protein